jgi:hypothetical protein
MASKQTGPISTSRLEDLGHLASSSRPILQTGQPTVPQFEDEFFRPRPAPVLTTEDTTLPEFQNLQLTELESNIRMIGQHEYLKLWTDPQLQDLLFSPELSNFLTFYPHLPDQAYVSKVLQFIGLKLYFDHGLRDEDLLQILVNPRSDSDLRRAFGIVVFSIKGRNPLEPEDVMMPDPSGPLWRMFHNQSLPGDERYVESYRKHTFHIESNDLITQSMEATLRSYDPLKGPQPRDIPEILNELATRESVSLERRQLARDLIPGAPRTQVGATADIYRRLIHNLASIPDVLVLRRQLEKDGILPPQTWAEEFTSLPDQWVEEFLDEPKQSREWLIVYQKFLRSPTPNRAEELLSMLNRMSRLILPTFDLSQVSGYNDLNARINSISKSYSTGRL